MNSENRAPQPTAPQPTEAPELPRKSPRPAIWAVAAGLGALGIFTLMRSQTATDATASGTPSGTPSGIQATPLSTPEVRLNRSGTLAASSRNPLSNSFSEPQLIFFVPDDQGEMKKRTMAPRGDIPGDPRAAREKVSMQAVQALMQAAPDIFPPQTMLHSVSMDGSAATLDFNAAMAKPDFWQGSALTRATLDSLAMTVAATKNQVPGDNSQGVRLSVDGKLLPNLGEMDLSQPYTPSTQAPPGSQP